MTTLQSYGDSIPAGQGVTSSFVSQTASHYGWYLINNAVPGDMAIDQSWRLNSTSTRDITTVMVGTNDCAVYGSGSTPRLNNYINAMRAMAVVNGGTTVVPAVNLTLSGTWYTTTATGASFGKYTADTNATATATVNGPVVWVGYLQFSTTDNSAFEVWIDGVMVEYITLDTAPICNTGNGKNYGDVCRRYGGLSNGPHTVVIKNKSPNILNLEFIASQSLLFMSKPVFFVNTPFKGSYNSIDSAANVTSFCTALNGLVTELQNDGFNCHLIDANSILVQPTDFQADGLHPNAAGHTKIYNALKTAIDTYAVPTGGSSVTFPTGTITKNVTLTMTCDGSGGVTGPYTLS